MQNKAVFLDRDGVINKMVYLEEEGIIDAPFSVSQFELVESVPEAILNLKKNGYKVIVISNQPGIAKGYYGKKTFDEIQRKMHRLLEEKNVKLDDEFYCFHHPQAKNPKYKKICDCRKPRIGLILKATKIHDVDLKNSYFIGDGMVDLEAAKEAGCKSIFIGNTSSLLSTILAQKGLNPVYVAHNLDEAVNYIVEKK